MIHSTIRLIVSPEKREEALAILLLMAKRGRVEPGCISCRIYRDALEERIIMIEEEWKNEEDLKRHLRSDEYRNVLIAMEMAVELPEVKFETILRTNGIETIETARSVA
ncbi:MAG TPA: antibiotic biosynthesis monooxygenase [Nitrospirota bacterium]|nr:antibiotic biosynthesis monooxygenase [Nitrospirota bacterium]